jgi:hypothetical protein
MIRGSTGLDFLEQNCAPETDSRQAHTPETIMDKAAIERIRKAVQTAHDVVHTAKLDSCDVDDIDEVIDAVNLELARASPNRGTLATYLNSLARSLRSEPPASDAYIELNQAMRHAGVPEI